MKQIVFLSIVLFHSVLLTAQENPVKWTSKAEKISDVEYKLIIDGQIQPNWNIYSQFLESQDGPVATTLGFVKDGFDLIGKAEESGHKKEGFDEMFGMNVVKYSEHIIFEQKIKVTNKGLKKVSLTLNFMSCNNEVCLPPRDEKILIVL